MKSRQNSRTFTIIFLGMLSAFGPFVMDMYLPTLPAMTGYFNTSSSMVQLGLTASMIGLAAGQLVFGPVSDKFGRRSSLLAAMILFLLSTAGCILSETILQFVALRLVQGIAGAGGVVISRSIAADKYAGHELAAMLAIIGAINGIATVAAPHCRRHFIRNRRMAWNILLPALSGSHSACRKLPFQRIIVFRTTRLHALEQRIPTLQNRDAQQAIPLLHPAIRIDHGGALRQHCFCPVHHAAALWAESDGIQPLLRGQCYRNGHIVYRSCKVPQHERCAWIRKFRHAASVNCFIRCTLPRMQLLDIRNAGFLPAGHGRNDIHRLQCTGNGLRTDKRWNSFGSVGRYRICIRRNRFSSCGTGQHTAYCRPPVSGGFAPFPPLRQLRARPPQLNTPHYG